MPTPPTLAAVGAAEGEATGKDAGSVGIANIIRRAMEQANAPDAGNVGKIADGGIRLEINRRTLKRGEQLYGIYRRRGKDRRFYRYLGTREKIANIEPHRLETYVSNKRERLGKSIAGVPAGGA